MDNKKLIVLVGGVLVLLLFGFFYLQGSKYNRSYNWKETYDIDSKEPYGAYIFHELMRTKFGDDNFEILKAPLSRTVSSKDRNTLYVILAKASFYGFSDVDTLSAFVKSGNDALIILDHPQIDLIEPILAEDCGSIAVFMDNTVSLSLEDVNQTYDYEFLNNWQRVTKFWSYIDSLDCAPNMSILGNINDEDPNFIKVRHGEGNFYLHTTPLAFANYYLKDKSLLRYSDLVMRNFSPEKVYWDNYSHIYNENNEESASPLKYILSQPSLKWAWYIFLFGVVIFVIFYAKRKQRIIPVLDPNVNTTIEYAETMGYLYFEEQSHRKIAGHKMNLFLTYVRNKYHLQTRNIDEDLYRKISLKSGVAIDEVIEIFKAYNRIDFKTTIEANDLIAFHNLLESFYHKCK